MHQYQTYLKSSWMSTLIEALKVVECHLLYQIVSLILRLVHQSTLCHSINHGPHGLCNSSMEFLNDHPPLKTTMRAQPKMVFEHSKPYKVTHPPIQ